MLVVVAGGWLCPSAECCLVRALLQLAANSFAWFNEVRCVLVVRSVGGSFPCLVSLDSLPVVLVFDIDRILIHC